MGRITTSVCGRHSANLPTKTKIELDGETSVLCVALFFFFFFSFMGVDFSKCVLIIPGAAGAKVAVTERREHGFRCEV